MTLHIKFEVNHSVSFFFMSHYSESWCVPHPSDAPGAKSYGRIRGLHISIDRGGPKESKNGIKKIWPLFWF